MPQVTIPFPFEGTTGPFECDALPDKCPFCHFSVAPQSVTASSSVSRSMFELVCKCPRFECSRLFVAHYRMHPGRYKKYELLSVLPITPEPLTFPETIASLSPSFETIYNQANAAESYQLHEIAGAGYRKALEFLIKDYCISIHPPELKESILNKFLGACIREYIDDRRIKECAQRAAWLGNDETHYIRKWKDKDIKDLKILIRLTVNWIENVMLTDEYRGDMPSS